MARYIDTKQGKNDARDMEMLFDEHISRLHYQNRSELAILYKEQRNRLSAALKADVVPVVHAFWFWTDDSKQRKEFQCSNCGKFVMNHGNLPYLEFTKTFQYCPKCGAKMDDIYMTIRAKMD